MAGEIILAAVEWGRSLVAAAETKAQKRSANVLERAAVLAAGMRYLDRRFVELFIPLKFYDTGSWPLERRRAHVEEILDFIYGDRVISDIRQAITWLDHSPLDDRHAQVLVENLCDVVRVALWRSESADVSQQLPLSGSQDTTWADGVVTLAAKGFVDLDEAAAPYVNELVALLRTDDPPPEEVRQAASRCLVPPRPMQGIRWGGLAPIDDRVLLGNFGEPDDLRRGESHFDWSPEWRDRWDYAHSDRPEDERRQRILTSGTVSPLRDFADNAGERFQELLAVVQGTFPAIPTPTWAYA
ncbi:hypothetical protein [Kribbella caucasensis]|nr:hypothetical protein [Kribbella sp. VKM Ac-2527]